MDPLTALSVAASVVQFVQFGCSLVSKSREIYGSTKGTLIQNIHLENTTNRLIDLNRWMVTSSQVQQRAQGVISPESQTLQAIYDDCLSVSTELIARLEKLKVQSNHKHKIWKSFRHALKSVWSKQELDALADKLLSHKDELDTYVLVSLSERFNNLSILQDHSFKTLDKTLQQSIEILLHSLSTTHKKMEAMLALQQQSVLSISQHKERTDVDRKFEMRSVQEFAVRAKKLDMKVDESLLRSLRFSTMYHRREEVSEAHQVTLSWIFQPPAGDDRPWSDFSEWLRKDNDMYWVNGKAGSGKSTLMKYIHDSPTTSQLLKTWSDNKRLLVAAYFFWNSGSLEQRSQSGVFRSLLFEMLQQDRSLIRKTFQKPWNEYRSMVEHEETKREAFQRGERQSLEESSSKSWIWKWPFRTLQQALTRLAALDDVKLCLLIDGLDECEGDHDDLAEYFRAMSSLPNVKICMSSRPWLVFEQVFHGYKGLRVQDLTCLDIQRYVNDQLVGNEMMQRLTESEPQAASKFVSTVTRKADGVFLWVKLVVKSLLKELRNQDGIADLQRRLESLPSDLNSLYSFMLDRIEPIYVEQASRIFQLYDCASNLNLRISALELDLAVTADFDTALAAHRVPMSSAEIASRSERITVHLKSRCEGLLEVHDLIDRRWDSIDADGSQSMPTNTLENDEDTLDGKSERLRTRVDLKVSYLHRTVKDFLKNDTVRAKLRYDTSYEGGFDPNFSLLISYIINLKFSICSFYYDSAGMSWDDRLWSTIRDAILFAGSMDIKHDSARNILLHELYALGCHWWQHKTLALDSALLNPSPYRRSTEWRSRFLSIAVCCGLVSYVDSELGADNSISRGPNETPLISYALGMIHNPTLPLAPQLINPHIVETLLQHGADPNEIWSRHMERDTIFEYVLQTTHSQRRDDTRAVRKWARILKAMLRGGGNIYATCPLQCGVLNPEFKNHSVPDVIVDTLVARAPEAAAELHDFLEQKRGRIRECSRQTNKRKREINDQERNFIDLTEDDDKTGKRVVFDR